MRLAKEKGWVAIILESDCQDAIERIMEEKEEENHTCRMLIENCKNLIKNIFSTIQHVLREANKYADKMARLRKSQHEKLVKVLIPSIKLIDDLNADLK